MIEGVDHQRRVRSGKTRFRRRPNYSQFHSGFASQHPSCGKVNSLMNPRLSAVFAVLFLAPTLNAQTDFSKVEIITTHIAGNVYMLEGSGGNIGVSAGPDGLL